MERISKDDYYLQIAAAVSARSTCLRKHYGAVIVKDDRIVATGYNGSPRGEANCCDVGACHAEQNALINASAQDLRGATIYLAGYDVSRGCWIEVKVCNICDRMIRNAGIVRVVGRTVVR